MADVDLEKLRSIGYVGKTRGLSRIRPLAGEGRVTGYEVDHADGRVEAVVRPETVRLPVSVSGADAEPTVNVQPASVAAASVVLNPGGD